MKRGERTATNLVASGVIAMGIVSMAFSNACLGETGAEILNTAGVTGGLVVHVGCGDGHLTAELGAAEGFIVQGLDGDRANVDRARATIRAAGSYGRVSAASFDGRSLPYADGLVNLVVGAALGSVAMEEVLRVLCPNGVVLVGENGTWKKTVKPRPAEIDEWTHYLHDAGNNAVSCDDLVGPPTSLQWVASPRWTRHHDHMSSISAVVSSAGRVFYIVDEGPTSAVQLPSDWKLVARDAFNGTLLWKRSIPTRFGSIIDAIEVGQPKTTC
jgi:SAM-dependent methyltransferase